MRRSTPTMYRSRACFVAPLSCTTLPSATQARPVITVVSTSQPGRNAQESALVAAVDDVAAVAAPPVCCVLKLSLGWKDDFSSELRRISTTSRIFSSISSQSSVSSSSWPVFRPVASARATRAREAPHRATAEAGCSLPQRSIVMSRASRKASTAPNGSRCSMFPSSLQEERRSPPMRECDSATSGWAPHKTVFRMSRAFRYSERAISGSPWARKASPMQWCPEAVSGWLGPRTDSIISRAFSCIEMASSCSPFWFRAFPMYV
mmetsp:Transcript_12256/g.28356  ORF Transcript_12256/g.28356 Transcript_12256/m.28356 type:complete len:263 (-) Transcript_12256:102-890(-)